MQIAAFPSEALTIARDRWPGATTLVLKAVPPLPRIGGDGGTVGLRIPNHPFALALLERSGPLAATSANPSGETTSPVVDDIAADLGDAVDLYVDGGRLDAPPSEVISVVGKRRTLRAR